VSRVRCQKCLDMHCKWDFCSREFVVPEDAQLKRFVVRLTVENADDCKPLPKFHVICAIYRCRAEDKCTKSVFRRTKAKLVFEYDPECDRSCVTLTHFLRCEVGLCVGDSLKFRVENVVCPRDTEEPCSDSSSESDSDCAHRRRPHRKKKRAPCSFKAKVCVRSTWEISVCS
jgi:hypothetical protein